jgi:hypothetical protein
LGTTTAGLPGVAHAFIHAIRNACRQTQPSVIRISPGTWTVLLSEKYRQQANRNCQKTTFELSVCPPAKAPKSATLNTGPASATSGNHLAMPRRSRAAKCSDMVVAPPTPRTEKLAPSSCVLQSKLYGPSPQAHNKFLELHILYGACPLDTQLLIFQRAPVFTLFHG